MNELFLLPLFLSIQLNARKKWSFIPRMPSLSCRVSSTKVRLPPFFSLFSFLSFFSAFLTSFPFLPLLLFDFQLSQLTSHCEQLFRLAATITFFYFFFYHFWNLLKNGFFYVSRFYFIYDAVCLKEITILPISKKYWNLIIVRFRLLFCILSLCIIDNFFPLLWDLITLIHRMFIKEISLEPWFGF